MSSAQLFRISDLALMVGAVAFIVYVVLRSALTARPDPVMVLTNGLWVPINVLGVAGAALVLLGLPAMYARTAGPAGVLGLVGFVLITLAWMFFGVFLSLYAVLVAPWLADQAPALVAASAPISPGIVLAFIAGLVAQLLGSVLLGIPFIRGCVQPRWVGYVLPISALAAVAGNIVSPGGPSADLAINLLSNLGPVLLLAAFGYLGSRLWAEHAQA